jgi:hypothetical protein
MQQHLRRRFWFEVGLACVALGLLAFTILQRNWIEVVFGVDPDRGNGSFEWALVLASIAVFTLASALARREWTRAATGQA